MANEFVARNGVIALTNSVVSGSLVVLGGITGSITSASYATTASYSLTSSFNISAGVSSNIVSNLVFSNANGVSFGLNNNTITATINAGAAGPARSFYQNVPVFQGSTVVTGGASSMYVQPVVLPYDISIGYVRFPVTMAYGQTSYASTANSSAAMNQAFSWYANIYTQGTGASSRSIQLLTQASALMLFQITGSIGAASNNQTVFQNFTVPLESGTTNFAATVSSNLSNQSIVSTNLTAFSGPRFIDLPFNTSLPAGNYWFGFQKSSNSTTVGNVAMSNVTANTPYFVATQINSNINVFGNSTAQSNGFGMFAGIWTTNVNGGTTNSINQTAILSAASQPVIPFQLIRQA